MGKNITYTCDKCGADIDVRTQCKNGTTGKMRFRVQNKIKERIPGKSMWDRCYQTVIMCPDCWSEFEKVYQEFMGVKEQNE
jgi:hypothetical protein